MSRKRTVELLRSHADAIRAHGVRHLALFGSVARGRAKTGSDVDVVVEIDPARRFGLIDLSALRLSLVDLLGQDVDVVIDNDLTPEFARRITKDRLVVF